MPTRPATKRKPASKTTASRKTAPKKRRAAKTSKTPTDGGGGASPPNAADAHLHFHAENFSAIDEGSSDYDTGAKGLAELRARKHVADWLPMNLARYAVERMLQLHRDSKDAAEKKSLETDMEILRGQYVCNALRQMGRESPGLCFMSLEEDAVQRIEILAERGMIAQDEDFRVSAVHDLAMILDAALEAMAGLAVKRKDTQAIRYLAWRADLAAHHLPKGMSRPLEKTIKAMGGEQWKAWQFSRKSRKWHGKHDPRTALGEWALKLWGGYQMLSTNVNIMDVSNYAVGFPDVPTPKQRWDFYLREFALPVEAVNYSQQVLNYRGEEFLKEIALKMLEHMYQSDIEVHQKRWFALVGDKYKNARTGKVDWSKITEQMRNGLDAWYGSHA